MNSASPQPVDVAIVGGGIVGLATAYQLLKQRPETSLIVLEKEADIATHQTGHNSGVIHSGIYYKPGSLRARNCRAGKQALEEFCEQYEIPFDRCGKVIVATNQDELSALERIYERGQANGVVCERISVERLAELEPHASGVAAIHVPETGIVDYKQVSQKLKGLIEQMGGAIHCSTEVLSISSQENTQQLRTTSGDYQAKLVVTAAGLQADRVARLAGGEPDVKIVPFRGEYYRLKPKSAHLCRNLIYPVPNPDFPFLGVHMTRMISGGVECGPNAVLALSREGYHWGQWNFRDLQETFAYSGFRKLGSRYWKMGLQEMWRSLSKKSFVRALQKLIPEIQSDDLESIPAGVRAQAVSVNGELLDDFRIDEQAQMIHVLNAPSPAATASLSIGDAIVERILIRFQ